MNNGELDTYLRKRNENEWMVLRFPEEIHAAYEATIPQVNGTKTIPEQFLVPGEHFAFLKHPRYIATPEHRHEFLEVNFVYSGECRQVINGKSVILAAGEFCMMDSNVIHSIEKPGDNDIIINLLMSKRFLDIDVMKRLSGNDLMSEFLVNSIYRSQDHNDYIIFRSSANRNTRTYMEQALCEYLDPTVGSEEAMNCHIILLFTELMRDHKESNAFKRKGPTSRAPITQIIQYINDNYKHVTLHSLASQFNYHPNYLSSLLKSHFGYGLMIIVQDLKIKEATMLLKYTNMTIGEIAFEVGYSNITLFYNHFKERHIVTPLAYRKMNS
ncbi:AraC family transcriptional regulator [Paenibacillus sp. IHBB 3054]|uniref:AraC family transcriptional regulator n=1 Tax=Paenibacillus sp. IHBB 3054 TaxID=3425689 RepID=UPI003F67C023